ncbi:MAG: triacylglycerol lipase [Solirubrobacteraceae bacterium]|jgi:pimeloyl-ACP methyl ester carboxylesterase|nr:triacylglycerol lipase [Solirubrobacteraceae bacterium]
MRLLLAAVLALAAALPAAALAQAPAYGPDTAPAGANDYACRPSAAHPNPVVLVHGLGANMQENWSYISPALADAGYCVFALTYGRKLDNPPPGDQPGGTVRMEDSVRQLAALVDHVLVATGAQKVDIVGHSEGSLMPDYYLRFLPEARDTLTSEPKVDRYVGMTPLWDGTDVGGVATISTLLAPTGAPDALKGFVAGGCPSCPEFLADSDFIAKLNAGPGPRVPGVTYTMLMTRNDELVEPYTSGIMDGATNIVVQDQCPADPSEHAAMAFDPIVLRDILNALDPAHAAAVDCTTYLAP